MTEDYKALDEAGARSSCIRQAWSIIPSGSVRPAKYAAFSVMFVRVRFAVWFWMRFKHDPTEYLRNVSMKKKPKVNPKLLGNPGLQGEGTAYHRLCSRGVSEKAVSIPRRITIKRTAPVLRDLRNATDRPRTRFWLAHPRMLAVACNQCITQAQVKETDRSSQRVGFSWCGHGNGVVEEGNHS